MSITQYFFDGNSDLLTNTYSSYHMKVSPPITRVANARFSDFEIPYSWYNVDNRWNSISFKENSANRNCVITFEEKNYDIPTFLADLQTKMNAITIVANVYTVLLDVATGFLTITASTQPFYFVFTEFTKKLSHMLGYWENYNDFTYNSKVQGAAAIFSLRPVKIINFDAPFTDSQTSTSSNCHHLYSLTTGNFQYGDIICNSMGIPLPWVSTNTAKIDQITLSISDQDGDPIYFNGMQIYILLEFLSG